MRLLLAGLLASTIMAAAAPALRAQEGEKGRPHETIEGNLRSFDLADDRFLVALVPEPRKGDTTRTFRVTDATVYHLDDKEAAKDDALRPGSRVKVTFSPAKPGVALKVRAYTSTAGEPRPKRHRTE
jgi:hypothetical protein